MDTEWSEMKKSIKDIENGKYNLPVNREMYQVFFPGKNRKDSLQNDVIVITRGKGLRKTTLAKYIAKLYKKYNKQDKIILLSRVDTVNFPSYVKTINLNNVDLDDESDIPPIITKSTELVLFKLSLLIRNQMSN
jgi:hypothetical protein